MPSSGAGDRRSKGLEVKSRKARKPDADQRLDGEHAGAQRVGQVGAEDRDRRAEQREDQRPQQHRALVVPPHAADLVEQRLGRMRVGDDVGDGEVRRDVGLRERAEGQDHQERLRERGGAAQRHQPHIAARRADQRQRPLHQRDRQRQDQGEVAQLRNHGACGRELRGRSAAATASARSLKRMSERDAPRFAKLEACRTLILPRLRSTGPLP